MKKIFLMSDIHGRVKSIKDLYDKVKEDIKTNEITIILLGDSGLNYFLDERDDQLKEALSNFPFTYFLIRGNHEERPSNCAKINRQVKRQMWHSETFWGNWVLVENKYSNIKYARDHISIYSIPYNNKIYRTIIIPGAYSVDKNYRLLKGWKWFPQEQLDINEKINGIELLKNCSKRFDLVLSHTCPKSYEPKDLFLPMINQEDVDKGMEEYLENIEQMIKYKVWCFGHFHASREYDRKNTIPSFENPRMLMLFNDYFVELDNIINNETVNFL